MAAGSNAEFHGCRAAGHSLSGEFPHETVGLAVPCISVPLEPRMGGTVDGEHSIAGSTEERRVCRSCISGLVGCDVSAAVSVYDGYRILVVADRACRGAVLAVEHRCSGIRIA